jgi:hypothetical protein
MNAEIIKAVGLLLAHCTPSKNLPSIKANGLLPAACLAKQFNIDPSTIALINERKSIQSEGNTAQLNHQKTILHGLSAANRIVEGHDAISWAKQLDQRVFLWPQDKGKTFAKSIASDVPLTTLWIDTAALLEFFCGRCLVVAN